MVYRWNLAVVKIDAVIKMDPDLQFGFKERV
jgi:hypothetical protein